MHSYTRRGDQNAFRQSFQQTIRRSNPLGLSENRPSLRETAISSQNILCLISRCTSLYFCRFRHHILQQPQRDPPHGRRLYEWPSSDLCSSDIPRLALAGQTFPLSHRQRSGETLEAPAILCSPAQGSAMRKRRYLPVYPGERAFPVLSKVGGEVRSEEHT